MSRSAERCVQEVRERRRDELRMQKSRAYWPAPSGNAWIPSLSEESGAATLVVVAELLDATAWAGALLQLITHTSYSGCSTPLRPGLEPYIQPEKTRRAGWSGR